MVSWKISAPGSPQLLTGDLGVDQLAPPDTNDLPWGSATGLLQHDTSTYNVLSITIVIAMNVGRLIRQHKHLQRPTCNPGIIWSSVLTVVSILNKIPALVAAVLQLSLG